MSETTKRCRIFDRLKTLVRLVMYSWYLVPLCIIYFLCLFVSDLGDRAWRLFIAIDGLDYPPKFKKPNASGQTPTAERKDDGR